MLMTKKDIENRADVELLINSFYDKVKPDPVIGSGHVRDNTIDGQSDAGADKLSHRAYGRLCAFELQFVNK